MTSRTPIKRIDWTQFDDGKSGSFIRTPWAKGIAYLTNGLDTPFIVTKLRGADQASVELSKHPKHWTKTLNRQFARPELCAVIREAFLDKLGKV